MSERTADQRCVCVQSDQDIDCPVHGVMPEPEKWSAQALVRISLSGSRLQISYDGGPWGSDHDIEIGLAPDELRKLRVIPDLRRKR